MPITKVHIVGRFLDTDTVTPAVGVIEFKLRHQMQLDGEIIPAMTVKAPLDGNGYVTAGGTGPLYLAATDDPGVVPTGVGYDMEIRIQNSRVTSEKIAIPHTAPVVNGVPTLDLSTIAPALPSEEVFGYVLQADLVAEANARATEDALLASRTGTTLGGTSLVNGFPVIDYTTPWGVRNDGSAYYDANGAVSGEERVLVIGVDGSLNLVKPGG